MRLDRRQQQLALQVGQEETVIHEKSANSLLFRLTRQESNGCQCGGPTV